jgi:hypothetical protein
MNRQCDFGVARGEPAGQSLVEFALILPLLLVILLGVADLGRVFASAITAEAAVRNSAEAGAQADLQLDLLDGSPDGSLTAADYQALHATVLEVACREAERLPDRALGGSGNCVSPVIAVCVHDLVGGDSNCPETSAGFDPSKCTQMAAAWTTAQLAPASTPYVEVRMCYEFQPIIGVPLGDWGSVWLQRENFFTVAQY